MTPMKRAGPSDKVAGLAFGGPTLKNFSLKIFMD
jgi:hypothetical protein